MLFARGPCVMMWWCDARLSPPPSSRTAPRFILLACLLTIFRVAEYITYIMDTTWQNEQHLREAKNQLDAKHTTVWILLQLVWFSVCCPASINWNRCLPSVALRRFLHLYHYRNNSSWATPTSTINVNIAHPYYFFVVFFVDSTLTYIYGSVS